MTVQAGAVRRLLRPEQERERQALEAVEATGREALTEMRRLVGLLREQGAMPEFAPQPSMRTLDVLVGTVREAGPAGRARGRGRAAGAPARRRPLRLPRRPGGADERAQVRRPGPRLGHVRWRDGELELEIANDGRSEPGGDGGGHGLAGLRERVALVGGAVDVAARATGGGFVVRARLPLAEQRVTTASSSSTTSRSSAPASG